MHAVTLKGHIKAFEAYTNNAQVIQDLPVQVKSDIQAKRSQPTILNWGISNCPPHSLFQRLLATYGSGAIYWSSNIHCYNISELQKFNYLLTLEVEVPEAVNEFQLTKKN